VADDLDASLIGGSTQRYIWPWMSRLIDGFEAGTLLADRGYDTNSVILQAQMVGTVIAIPPKKNRTIQHEYDKNLYKLRRLVENAFLLLKRWCGIATRYAKNALSFLAVVHIRCPVIWLNLLV